MNDPRPPARSRLEPVRRPAFLLGTAALIAFLVVFGRVLLGERYLVTGDEPYEFPPFSATPAAHRPANPILSDESGQFLPYLALARADLLAGRMPLWNEGAGSGIPLLGGDVVAPFSPFTLAFLGLTPERGMTLAMLAKLLVAFAGMAAFVRAVGGTRAGAIVAGVAYAGSAFMVVWLMSPASSVAAVIPFSFALAERYLRRGEPAAAAGLALILGLQPLLGDAEIAAQFCLPFAAFVLLRLVLLRAWDRLPLLAGAGLLAALVGGVQLVPFVVDLSHSAALALRSSAAVGVDHLPAADLLTWLAPNAFGMPTLSRTFVLGAAPNYNESVAFVGVGALVLAALGLARTWRSDRLLAIALASLAVASLLVAYGPLNEVVGRLPLFSAARNTRFTGVAAVALTALGGLGFDALLERRPRAGALRLALTAVGALGLAGLVAAAAVAVRRGADVETMLGVHRGLVGFWVLTGGLSTLAAAALVPAAWLGRGAATSAVGLLVVVEAAFFAAPYNPQLRAADVRPQSHVVDWLAAHADGRRITGVGPALFPNNSERYGLEDARSYDAMENARTRDYWQRADPGFENPHGYIFLNRPDPSWLAAAGVRYVVSPGDQPLSGTRPVLRQDGVTVGEVPSARPLVFLADHATAVPDEAAALDVLALDPLGPVPVERSGTPGTGTGRLLHVSRVPGRLTATVDVQSPATLVYLDALWPGWRARIDGRAVPIDPAGAMFQSVQVPPGRHVVEFAYAPASVPIGAAASIAGLVLVALLGLLGLRR